MERPERERIVVVGHGMVAHHFCERLAERTADRFQLEVFSEETHPAYDRVHLSDYFAGKAAHDLLLTSSEWYRERGIELHLGDPVVEIDRAARRIVSRSGHTVEYDWLVLATGSAPFVPRVPGIEQRGVFVYRTLDDLAAIRDWSAHASCGAVIGGGLLGLEAAKALVDLGLTTHVVEIAPRLLPRQVDAAGGELLRRRIEALGVSVHLGCELERVLGTHAVSGIRMRNGHELPVDLLLVSAGIRPRDELARAAGLRLGPRGGIAIDDDLATSDPRVFAIGECASHAGSVYGLVAPGYQMAAALAERLCGGGAAFRGGDLSAKLKLLGVDVASVGDAFADERHEKRAQSVTFEDRVRGVYQKLLLSEDGSALLGAVLVGDVRCYARLLRAVRERMPVPEQPHELLFEGSMRGAAASADDPGEQVCSCNNVSLGEIASAIAERKLESVGGIKACTRAGTGCGGCIPRVQQILEAQLAKAGLEVKRIVCEHFPYSRQELFQIIKLGRIDSFDAVLAKHGKGSGCEICRPAVASILASTWSDLVLNHQTIQDTNDRFLANIQRGGTYSVIPRVPGGEITPEKLMALGRIAQRYDLYCKITGGQRIDLLGARVDQLPDIWEELVDEGFESGHAYGKALRTVKSCVGSTWCRFGVQDSTGLAIRLEERYRGIRAPHKLKSAVSGCIRECAEAQSKDFGVIATEKGWNLYLAGNGGARPRHADLIASDLDEPTLVRLIDRFLVYYIQTANPLERTARWIERMDGGIDYLRSVIVEDALGICAQLEQDMDYLVDSYRCEWAEVVRNPERRASFRHFANSSEPDSTLGFVREREQRRPADWADPSPLPAAAPGAEDAEGGWVRVAPAASFPRDGGSAVKIGAEQIAVFHFAARGEWYASQNLCPHRKDMVLGRGLLGDQQGEPKVACPMHKKTFSLCTGKGLNDASYAIRVFPVEVRDGDVYVKLPASGLEGAAGAPEICAPRGAA
jgi:nitrite reductase (NADH) large subunit